MRSLSLATAVLAAAFALAGCVGFEHSNSVMLDQANTMTRPSGSGLDALMGSWSSTTVVPSPTSCSNFVWNVTEQTGTSAKGSFTATCANDLGVRGTAQGTLSGASITWSAIGAASAPDLSSCAITLSGTAQLDADSVRVPYSGDTCLGKVSGVEVLQRR
ncbi:MAG TPA: hypothetical protein VFX12_11460 [Vicinamibacterales bacterium]|nr:hypothetical protein [Vicinamibacterales bacterium]